MRAFYKKHILQFKRPSGTSRGILKHKETWFLLLEENGKYGIGECGILRGLSIDDVSGYETKLQWLCDNITRSREDLEKDLIEFPSIWFGLEQAWLSLSSQNPFELFASSFVEEEAPIPINGLVWMGNEQFMHEQIQEKLDQGFRCIKMKIGAIDFNKEIALLKTIRNRYSKEEIEIRVDANGAFTPSEALDKLTILSQLELHSLEQPIRQGHWNEMGRLCAESPLPIALDEELIGVFDKKEKEQLLDTVKPQYIILKPSLVGGYKGSMEWIELAEKMNVGWWVTSALESNIGLNAIAQWTYTLENSMPQGLGTGSLYLNNFSSPLTVEKGTLYYARNKNWQTNLIEELCT